MTPHFFDRAAQRYSRHIVKISGDPIYFTLYTLFKNIRCRRFSRLNFRKR